MRRLPIRFLPVALVLLAPGGAGAQQAAALTLAEAVDLALRQDPALVIAAAGVARAQSGVREAQAARLPALHLDANLTRFEEPMVVAPIHGLDPRNLPVFDRTLSQNSATLGWTLFDAARGPRVERAQALAAAAHGHARSVRLQLLADVVAAFFSLQSAREIEAAQAARVTALAREAERAAQLVREGRAARVVLLRSEAALSAARADAVGSQSQAVIAANGLARLLAVDTDSLRARPLEPARARAAAAPAAAELRALALASNPALQRARRGVDAARAAHGEARGSWLPRLQLGGRFVEYVSTETRPQGEWQGGVQLTYPVFTGGARRAASDRAAADVAAAQAEVDLALRGVDAALDRALAAYQAARARVAALDAAVAQSEEVTRIDRLALSAGAGVQTDYLAAEADLFRARAALTDARATEAVALVELARITGQLDEAWLAANLESFQ